MSVSREQIRREATRVIERSDDTHVEWAEWCIALLDELAIADSLTKQADIDREQARRERDRALQKAKRL